MTAYLVTVHAVARGRVPAKLRVISSLGPGDAVRLVLRAAAWLGLDVADVHVEESGRLGTARADGPAWSVVASAVGPAEVLE